MNFPSVLARFGAGSVASWAHAGETTPSSINSMNGATCGRAVARALLVEPAGKERRHTMLETIAILLIILWLLGLVSGYTLGNFIYILLVIALVLIVVRLVSGRRV